MTSSKIGLIFLFLFASGCGHFVLPASRLEPAEATGPGRVGRLDAIGIQSGTDLSSPSYTVPPKAGSTDAPTTALNASWANPFFAFTAGIGDQTDGQIKFEVDAPLMLKIKQQFYGESASKATHGNFSVSGSLGAGFMLGTDTSLNSWTYLLGDVALLAGYRFNIHHALTLSPYLSVPALFSDTTSNSGTEYGVGLLYQYTIESVFVSLEVNESKGSFAGSSLGGPTGSFAVGLNL